MASRALVILDLFAGPGGWSEGLRLLGLADFGIELDAAACATRYEAGHATWQADVAAIDPTIFAGTVDGLIASPPCQDFSLAGKRAGRTGEKGRLIDEVPRWVDAIRPEWVACEQVPPALDIWVEFARLLETWGYSTWAGILNAADYGVPQTRQRAFLLAHRTRPAGPPTPTHDEHPHPVLFGPETRPWVSMAEALGWGGEFRVGFPRLDDRGDSPDGYRERDWRDAAEPSFALTEKARSWVAIHVDPDADPWELDEPYLEVADPHGLLNDPEALDGLVVNTGRDWKAGGSRVDTQTIPVTAPAPALDGKGRWHLVRQATGQRGQRARDTIRADDEPAPALAFGHNAAAWTFDRPATTVAGDPRVAQPGHKRDKATPESPGRMEGAIRLGIREALILQSFRPDYPVQGTKSKQFEQVGNAVPPRLAAAVLGELLGIVG